MGRGLPLFAVALPWFTQETLMQSVHRIGFRALWLGMVLALSASQTRVALAQDEAPGDLEEEEPAEEAPAKPAAPEEKPEPPPQPGPTVAAPEPVQAAPQRSAERENIVDGNFSSQSRIGWDGGLEVDVGYVSYASSDLNQADEEIFDSRGRFVFGPVLDYDFGDSGYFFRATGQAVMWVREVGGGAVAGTYQINVDDVYGLIGKRNTWDFKVGRFELWPVYHKGLGFDIYTLEDTGALRPGAGIKFSSKQFGADIYEVNFIHLREAAARAALQYYPLKDMLGFQLGAVYGTVNDDTNTVGTRLAGDFQLKFLRVSAAAEYRIQRPTDEKTGTDPSGASIPCSRCGLQKNYGFGGGVVASVAPVEAGLNYAKAWNKSFALADGTEPPGGQGTRTSIGGYLQVDPGSLIFKRSLIVGVGINRTEVLNENDDFERHVQSSAYVAFPLGFNKRAASLGGYANYTMLKLVLSRAELLVDQRARRDAGEEPDTTDMLAGRIRLAYYF